MEEAQLIKSVLTSWQRRQNKRPGPKVAKLDFRLGPDSTGEDAVYVYVTLKDRARGLYSWPELKPLEEGLRKAIWSKDDHVWPYVHFRLASERIAG